MDIKIKVDDKEYPMDYEMLSRILYIFPEADEYSEFYFQLAHSPDSELRENVAGKSGLNNRTIEVLQEDTQLNVLKELLSNSEVSKNITEEKLDHFISLDDDQINVHIAENIEDYESCDIGKIAKKFISHQSPRVRGALANNLRAPKHILKKLLKDDDPYVARSAKSSLEY